MVARKIFSDGQRAPAQEKIVRAETEAALAQDLEARKRVELRPVVAARCGRPVRLTSADMALFARRSRAAAERQGLFERVPVHTLDGEEVAYIIDPATGEDELVKAAASDFGVEIEEWGSVLNARMVN